MGAIASETVLKAIIRKRCDGADTDLLSDATLDNYLDDAVNRVNELNPRLILSQLTTVANTQDYQLTGGGANLSNFLGLEAVFYDQTNTGFLADEFPTLWSRGLYSPIAEGISVFDNPSLVEIYYRKDAAYAKAFDGSWTYVEKASEAYIRLEPAPGVGDSIVPYLWWQKRTLDDMESWFQQKLVDLAAAYCLQSIGSRLEMHPEVSMGGFKGKSTGAHLIRRGEKLEQKAEGRLILPPLLG